MDSREVGKRAVRGSAALGARQLAVHGMNVGAGILLMRLLAPEDFGVLAILNFFIALAALLSEFGLGYSLLRQKEEPAPEDYQAVLCAQAALSGGMAAAIWAAAPWLAAWLHMGGSGALMLRVVTLNILLSALQAMAATKLERRMDFGAVARVEVAQNVLNHTVALALAFSGAGAWSFVAGAAARSVFGTVLLSRAASFRPAFRWDWRRVAPRLGAALAYQGSSLVNLARDSLVPALAGSLAGPLAVGYIAWSLMLSVYTNVVLNILNRLYLPVFSRLQGSPDVLAGALGRAVAWTNRFSAPVTVFLAVFANEVVAIVFTEKWLPALPLVYLLLAANVTAATALPCFGMLNALGKSRLTLAYSVAWAALTWALGAPLISRLGFVGFGWTALAVSVTNLLLFRDCRKAVPAPLLASAAPPWLWAAAVGAAAWGAKRAWPVQGPVALTAFALAGAAAYLALLWAFHRGAIRRDFALFRGGEGA